MAKVLVSEYRYAEAQDDGTVKHTVLRPGDDPKDLPKEVRKELEDQKLIMDEKRYDSRNGVVIPLAELEDSDEEEEEEIPRNTPIRTPSQLAGSREAQAKALEESDSKSSKKG